MRRLFVILLISGCGPSGPDVEPDSGDNATPNVVPNNAITTPTADCALDATTHNGEGTYYDADGSGACGFAPTGDLMVAAFNPVDFAESGACGGCVAIDGPNGSVNVRVVDLCPECPEGNVDLSREAFERIAPVSAGRVPITWRAAPCEVSGPIVYHFKDGSNQWWTALQVRNSRHAIASFEVRGDDGTYRSVPRLSYNYFVDESGMGPGPYGFRVTDVTGQVLEDDGIQFIEDGDRSGASQFARCE